jgi:hypothetical protein
MRSISEPLKPKRNWLQACLASDLLNEAVNKAGPLYA